MKRTKNRAYRVTRTALAAVAALGMLMAFMGTGSADPANNGEAAAFGLEATGILPIAKTPEVRQVGEGRDTESANLNRETQATLTLPLANLAVEALLNTTAEVRLAGGINEVALTKPATANQNPIDLRDVNARGYAAADNLKVLIDVVPAGVDPNLNPELIREALVDVDLIEAEAVAKCVNNVPQFDTGFNVLDDDAAGIELDPVEDIVANLLRTLTGPGAPLSAVVKTEIGVEERIPNGIRMTALRLSVLGTTEVINIAQAEAKMNAPCGVAAPAPPSPAARLAQTGGGGMSSILGGSLLAGAVLMMIFVRKYRLSE